MAHGVRRFRSTAGHTRQHTEGKRPAAATALALALCIGFAGCGGSSKSGGSSSSASAPPSPSTTSSTTAARAATKEARTATKEAQPSPEAAASKLQHTRLVALVACLHRHGYRNVPEPDAHNQLDTSKLNTDNKRLKNVGTKCYEKIVRKARSESGPAGTP